MKVTLSGEVTTDYSGFVKLIDLNSKLNSCAEQDIEVDIGEVRWFDANMCAVLGAILYRTSRRLNSVRITNPSSRVENILSKNKFFALYGGQIRNDTYETTIPYRHFVSTDSRSFAEYCIALTEKKGLPKMSQQLTKAFLRSINEIFGNSVTHSETKHGICSCGQYYPKNHNLDFTIADLGIGIAESVRRYGIDRRADEAIVWAIEKKNTTKVGSVPGGSGLKLLREFIELNGGKIQIVSDRGYWELADGKSCASLLDEPFPGTIVNIHVKTDDKTKYMLRTEMDVDPTRIFG